MARSVASLGSDLILSYMEPIISGREQGSRARATSLGQVWWAWAKNWPLGRWRFWCRTSEVLGELGIARLGEIYLHARFRDAVPTALVEEFVHLEPKAFAAVERLQAAEIVRE